MKTSTSVFFMLSAFFAIGAFLQRLILGAWDAPIGTMEFFVYCLSGFFAVAAIFCFFIRVFRVLEKQEV